MRRLNIFLCFLLLLLSGRSVMYGQGNAPENLSFVILRCSGASDHILAISDDAGLKLLNTNEYAEDLNLHTTWGMIQADKGQYLFQIINGQTIYLKATPNSMSLTIDGNEATEFLIPNGWDRARYYYNGNTLYYLRYSPQNGFYSDANDNWDYAMPSQIISWRSYSWESFSSITIDNFPLTQAEKRPYVILNDAGTYIIHNGNNVTTSTTFDPSKCIWTSTTELTDGGSIDNNARQALSFEYSNNDYTLAGRAPSLSTTGYKSWTVTDFPQNGSNNLSINITSDNVNSLNQGESKVFGVNATGSVTITSTNYQFASADHYVSSNGTYLGSSPTIDYYSSLIQANWSITNNSHNSASLTGTSKDGATLNYNTDGGEQQTVGVRLTVSSSLFDNNIIGTYNNITLKSLYMVGPGQYVIRISGMFLTNNSGQVGTSSTFDPATCLWTATGSTGILSFSNSGKYLSANGNSITLSNSSTNWTVSDTEGGRLKLDGKYLSLNGDTWQLTSGDGTACAYKVETTNQPVQQTTPQISGTSSIDATGNFFFNHTDASYIPAYTDYRFDAGTHHYFCETTGLANSNQAPQSIPFTYTWSISANASGHMTVNQDGQLNYSTQLADNAQITLTLTATSSEKTFSIPKSISVNVSLSDIYCYFRNESRQQGENTSNVGDYYLTTSNETYNGNPYLKEGSNRQYRELWLLKKYDNKYFQIIHVEDGRYMVTKNGMNSSDSYQTTYLAHSSVIENNDVNNSLFVIGKHSNGSYYIQPKCVENTNLSFNPMGWGTMDIFLHTYEDAGSRWIIERQDYTPVEDGYWHIRNSNNTSYYLNITNGNVRAIQASGLDNISATGYWQLRRSGNVYYQILSSDGRYLTHNTGNNSFSLETAPQDADNALFRIGTSNNAYYIMPKKANNNTVSLSSYNNINNNVTCSDWETSALSRWIFVEPVGALPGQYVISGTDGFLANAGGSLTRVQDFNPATCIWTASGSNGQLTLSNGGKYISNNNGNAVLSNSPTTWAINTSYGGSISNNTLTLDEKADLITSTDTDGIETEPSITGGTSSIDDLGNFQFNHTEAQFINAHCYVWNNQNHYVSPDGLTYYGTVAPVSESFTYTWSLPDYADGYMNFSGNGLLNYDTEFEEPTTVKVTLTAQSASKTYTVSRNVRVDVAGFCAPAGNYVLYSSDRFLSNANGNVNSSDKFYPGSCIWTATATTINGTNCLYFTNNNNRLRVNNNEYWVVSSNGGGSLQSVTTGDFLYLDTNDKQWKTGENPDGAAYAVSGPENVSALNQTQVIGTEETTFDELRNYKFFITREAANVVAYRIYTLNKGPKLYVNQDGSQYFGTSAPASELYTYRWSIDNPTGNVSIDQNGNLSYSRSFSAETQITITLMATNVSRPTDTKTTTKRVTLKPASSSYAQAQYEDRYVYIVNHSTTGNQNDGSYYLYPTDGNENHLRTYRIDNLPNRDAIWILRKYSNDTYQLIHASDGKYVIANTFTQGENALYLASNDDLLSRSLYTIGEFVMEQYGYYIRPASSNPDEEYGLSFNPIYGNGNNIGLYPCKMPDHNKVSGSMWFIQDAKVATPSILADNGKITITCQTKDAVIRYTTDGTDPTNGSPRYLQPFDYNDGDIIKARAFVDGYIESNIAIQTIKSITSLDQITADGATGYYILTCDIEAPADFESIKNFNGVFDGGYHTISGLQQPLFYNTVDAIVKNIRLDNVNISGTGNLGSIACLSKGRSIFLNCGVLASNASTISGGTNVGSIVGQIEDLTRVINCYSYATLQGTTVGGIVGNNASTASVIDDIHTMVMNCIFYGDLDESSTRISPVYGGTNISNRNNLNTYTFYQAFDEQGNLKYNSTATNNSMPVTDNSYLDRFEFYRSMLNSHRELSAFYAFDDNKRYDQIGKWILDTDIAPYPIVTYWNTRTRKTLERAIPQTGDDFAGRQLKTVQATFVIEGETNTIRDEFTLPVTDMDTAHWDYTYGKIVLPFANEIYPAHSDWQAKKVTDDDYKSMIITGWEVTSITGGTVGTITSDYNYSDPLSTAKDIFKVSNSNNRDATFNPFVYAQGGNFVVPEGVTAITFTAHWAPCVYISDAGEDVSYNPEFTESTQIGSYSWENRTEAIVSSSFRDKSYKESGKWIISTNPATDGYPDGQGERWDNINDFLEFYRHSSGHSFEISQTITLEPGTYMLRFYGFSRHSDYSYLNRPKTHDNMYGKKVYMFAKIENGEELKRDTLKNVYDHTAQEMNAVMEGVDAFNPSAANNMDGYIHSLSAAKIAFDHGYFLNELMFEVPEPANGTTVKVEIHIKSEDLPSHSWCTFRDMKLYKLIDETYIDISYQKKKVVHNVTDALKHLSENEIPNNQAIVLVGNYHLNDRIIGNSFAEGVGAYDLNKAITFMSIDDDFDQEPDYCMYMYTSNPEGISRTDTPPLRFDFLTCPGIGMAARVSGSSAVPGIGIWHTRGWYETTETYLGIHSEAEINPSYKRDGWISPWIINGGLYSQIIMNYDGEKNLNTNNYAYIRLGGNALIRQFHPGNHEDKDFTTYLLPVNVNGGEIEECYMTGREGNTDNPRTDGNVRFWSNSGYIHEFLGAYMAPVNGNVTAKMDHTLIDNFYGGGMNANQPVNGNIDVTANNCWIDYYVGGPKVGDMTQNTSVTTHATGTLFGNFFGGGYGGTSIARKTVWNETVGVEVSISSDLEFPVAFTNYTGRRLKYEAGYGIATGYGFEYFFEAGGQGNLISRFFVDYSSLSLATVRQVNNTLNNCTIKNDFYGGGRQGYVDGNITSTLTDCTVKGSAFAGGYTGRYKETPVSTTEKPEYSTYLFGMGVFTPFGTVEPETYHWEQAENIERVYNSNTKSLFTTDDMSLMGKVNGTTSLTIDGASTIEGNVFGGGNQADVNGSTNVIILSDDTNITGTVFGGGNESNVTNENSAAGNTTVTITGGSIGGDVFGGGNQGNVSGNPHVTIGQQQ